MHFALALLLVTTGRRSRATGSGATRRLYRSRGAAVRILLLLDLIRRGDVNGVLVVLDGGIAVAIVSVTLAVGISSANGLEGLDNGLSVGSSRAVAALLTTATLVARIVVVTATAIAGVVTTPVTAVVTAATVAAVVAAAAVTGIVTATVAVTAVIPATVAAIVTTTANAITGIITVTITSALSVIAASAVVAVIAIVAIIPAAGGVIALGDLAGKGRAVELHTIEFTDNAVGIGGRAVHEGKALTHAEIGDGANFFDALTEHGLSNVPTGAEAKEDRHVTLTRHR